ncbi:MAG: OB-fold nucleic acid binding domain-containing protein [Candidatus Nanoarchaeia archaeon]|jgi:replication factor A1|nr:OB-fold nucleic acid binding domain-containing protein [Candidatus Nanoarchaeia archaeon]MDD3993646.1 OB-fold nucleic acid binding domain-containing protein [Candidatus Nanoarchaeia archaeon]
MQNYDLLIDRISKASNIEKDEIERRVEAKKAKLSGLISKEGAAQIIAAELGISFENQDLKISEIMPGMRKVNVIGKIINLFPVREYEKNGKSGKVSNFILADETGNCRVVLWDMNHISLIENSEIKEGDSVEIKNASIRNNEIHLSGFSEFKKSNKTFDNVLTKKVTKEETIDEIQNGQSVKLRGLVVQVFPVRYYNICPDCGKKVVDENGFYNCNEHGKVEPKKRGILNLVLDDGNESIRVVIFGENINSLGNEQELEDPEKFNTFKDDLLGTEIYIEGNVRRNSLFNNLELIATNVSRVDVEELIQKLES